MPAPAWLPPEARLHLAAAQGSAADDAVRGLLAGALDWERVLAVTERDRAHAALWERITAAGAERVPPLPRERLRRLGMIAAFRQGALERRLVEVLDAMVPDGIPVLLLKGAALAVGVYGSFAARPMADLDVLVPADAAGRVQRRLRASGWRPALNAPAAPVDAVYARHHHLPPLLDPLGSGVVLEVHSQPLPPGHPFALDAGALWRDARPVQVHGRASLAPSGTHQLLHLCVHFAWAHALQSGAWRTLRDVRTLAERAAPDWSAFARSAREARAETCAYWTLRLARALVGASIPSEVVQALRPRAAEAELTRLERHLTATLFGGAACPSPWLGRRLWERAILPRRSGHGAARPWSRDADFPAAGIAPAAGSDASDGPSWRDVVGWRRWLAAVAAAPLPRG